MTGNNWWKPAVGGRVQIFGVLMFRYFFVPRWWSWQHSDGQVFCIIFFSVDLIILNFQILRSPGACSGSWNSLWRKPLWDRAGNENWSRWPAATPPSNLPLTVWHLLNAPAKQTARPRWKIRVLKMQTASLLKQSFLLLKRRSVEMLFLLVARIEPDRSTFQFRFMVIL